MERRLGHDFANVRVHSGPDAAASARALQAQAYTVGSDVVFGADRYRPRDPAGQALLAHELTHVVQQTAGSARAATGSPQAAEAEAQRNQQELPTGRPLAVSQGLAGPTLQRQADKLTEEKEKKKEKTVKPKGEISRTGKKKTTDKTTIEEDGKTQEETTVKPENKFSFKTTIGLPVLPGGRLGPFTLLDDLKLTAKTTRTQEEPIPVGGTQLDDIDTELAFKLIQWRVSDLTGASIGLSAGQKTTFGQDPSTKGRLGFSGDVKGGLQEDFSFGSLKLTGSTSFSGSVTDTLRGPADTKTSLGATAKGGLSFTSPTFGVFGADTQVVAGASGTAGATFTDSSKTGSTRSLSAGGSGELGLKSKLGSQSELMIKATLEAKVQRDLTRDLMNATVQTTSTGTTVGFGATVSF